VVVDLMCDARVYEPANFAADGFHPNDHGYELLAEKLFGALGEHAVPPPASCPQMTAAGRSG
jgi:lysophospholipase L1-like esterase